MKFGKTFQDTVIAEWHIYALDYHSLKIILKDEEKEDYLITDDDQKQFFAIIDQSLRKLENFFAEQKQWALKKVKDLTKRVNSFSDEKKRQEIISSLLEFEFELGFVIQFFQLNLTGISKILKKYDKRTGSIVRQNQLKTLEKTHSFLNGQYFEDLCEKSNKMRESVEQKEVLSIADKTSVEYRKLTLTKSEKHAIRLQRKSEQYISNMLKKSHFFKSKPKKTLAEFTDEEMKLGTILGEGEYSTVQEVQEFFVNERCHVCFLHKGFDHIKALQKNLQDSDQAHNVSADDTPKRSKSEKNFQKDQISETSETDTSEGDNLETDHGDDEMELETRGFMKDHCIRRGFPRYAVKTLKASLKGRELEEASLDLAIEAKFLAVLNHPNVVKIRGSCGNIGHPNFQIILDRLYGTLEEQCENWSRSLKETKGRFCFPRQNKANLKQVWTDRLLAAFDISRALNYLHKNQIIFRDLKPQNIGFDIRGNAKIFDFGLAKELIEVDRVGEDQYMASGLTGSRRYMAPEVVSCKPYGFTADVYSFAIVLWEMFALKIPFEKYNYEQHKKLVVWKGKRLKIPSKWPMELKDLIQVCWSQKPFLRPKFFTICQRLKDLVDTYDCSFDLSARSHRLLDTSVTSRLGDIH